MFGVGNTIACLMARMQPKQSTVFEKAIAWIIANPYKAAWHTFHTVLFFAPNMVTNAIFTVSSWSVIGPIAGICPCLRLQRTSPLNTPANAS
jgi:hypothetical protein